MCGVNNTISFPQLSVFSSYSWSKSNWPLDSSLKLSNGVWKKTKLGLFMPSNKVIAYLIPSFQLSLLSSWVAGPWSEPIGGIKQSWADWPCYIFIHSTHTGRALVCHWATKNVRHASDICLNQDTGMERWTLTVPTLCRWVVLMPKANSKKRNSLRCSFLPPSEMSGETESLR